MTLVGGIKCSETWGEHMKLHADSSSRSGSNLGPWSYKAELLTDPLCLPRTVNTIIPMAVAHLVNTRA